ncbi:MAG: hypothetical protein JWN86_426 [Planctomycetota bacterium]|nr:hypothetical protein [Planctomycetota bacterium]
MPFKRPYTGLNKPLVGAQINRTHPLSQGLMRQFLFAEGGGTALADLVGGRNLATSNAPPWGNSPYGPKLTYNGTNQQATGNDAGLPTGTNPVTIAVLFRATAAASNMCLLGYGQTTTNNNNFHVMCSGGKFKLGAVNVNAAGTLTVNDGLWHLGVGIFSGGNVLS